MQSASRVISRQSCCGQSVKLIKVEYRSEEEKWNGGCDHVNEAEDFFFTHISFEIEPIVTTIPSECFWVKIQLIKFN